MERSNVKMFSRAILLAITCAAVAGRQAYASETSGSRGQIVIVEHAEATEAFTPRIGPIKKMVQEGLLRVTGKSSTPEAWLSLISTQDVVGIKVHSAPGQNSGTRPAVAGAVVESLLQAGINPAQIIIWDRRLVDLRLAGFFKLAEKYQITVKAAIEEGFSSTNYYETQLLGKLVYGDLEFGQKGERIGRNSYVSKLLTGRITKIVNLTPLLNHNIAGVSGVLHGLALGSVDNVLRFEDISKLARAVPEIYALPEIGDRVVLNIVDALICQYQGEERSLLHYSSVLNQLWFSTDPVALDVVALEELDRAKSEDKSRKAIREIYSNAELLELGTANPRQIKIERVNLQ